jgi:metallo-beta-lactamase class B
MRRLESPGSGSVAVAGMAATLLLLLLAAPACGPRRPFPSGLDRAMRRWNEPAEPFRVVGNIHFVGTNELAIFLVTTPAGHILIDSGFDETVPLIRAGTEQLGFRFEDVRILVSSHAHKDHVGGHARVKRETGARIYATAPDAAVIRTGGGGTLALDQTWPAVEVDGLLQDGQTIEIGGTTLVAHLTAGHTPGATTWTTTVEEAGRRLAVVFFSSSTLFKETPLIGNEDYPGIVADFERSYAFWTSVPCDVFLAPHGAFFGIADKRQRQKRGESPSPFIDPDGWKNLIGDQQATFRGRLAGGR